MKKVITLLAVVLAASTALTGCGKQTEQASALTSSKESSVVNESITSEDEDIELPLIYAYGKENIPELVAKALTALGSGNEETFERCIGDEYLPEWEHYKSIHERIYRAVEKNNGDPTQKFTCTDFTVYQYDHNEAPKYYAYLNNYEESFCFNIRSRVNDIDKQEYYLEIEIKDIDYFYSIESAREHVQNGEYILLDLTKYVEEEANSNE